MGYNKGNITEFHAQEKVSVPIIKFPQFDLRVQLIEKNAERWLCFLETYVGCLQFLLAEGRLNNLDENTTDQLIIFVKSYLHEMAYEEGKVHSLEINEKIKEQLGLLKIWVLFLIRSCGLLHLQIFSDTIWSFIALYGKEYSNVVTGLINGSVKPVINTQKVSLNNIYQIQQHLKNQIESNKFSRLDLKTLEILLSSKGKKGKPKFADEFVTRSWIIMLEGLYKSELDGNVAEWGKKLGILSYISISEDRHASLIGELEISSPELLANYPLYGSVLLSDGFKNRKMGLYNRISILRLIENSDNEDKNQAGSVGILEVKNDDVDTITNIFSNLSETQARQLLFQFRNDVELIIDLLFENPKLADSIDDMCSPTKTEDMRINHTSDLKRTELTVKDSASKQTAIETLMHVPDEVKNKTITRTLQLLYSEYDDERDDTYEEADVPSGTLEVVSEYDQTEAYLWNLLKKDGSLFSRELRGTSKRKDMKKQTSWSDEQIEGWSRMIERSPRRARHLEEKYLFCGNIRRGKTSYVKKNDEDSDTLSLSVKHPKDNRALTKSDKAQYAHKERKKYLRANHNRKFIHDKKVNRSLLPSN